jgi:hypothetical protein
MSAKKTNGKKVVKIELKDTAGKVVEAFEFHVGIENFNLLQNEMLPNEKVTPSENFLTDTVQGDDDTKQRLVDLLDQGFALELAAQVSAQFKPALSISVK